MRSQMDRFYRLPLFMLLLTLMIVSCGSYARKFEVSIPVPKNAFDVQRHFLKEDQMYQVDFKVDIPFEETSASDYYLRYYMGSNWRLCKNKNSWEDVSKLADTDGTKKKKIITIHRYVYFMVSGKEQKLVRISLWYKFDKNNKYANNHKKSVIQHVRVDLYRVDGKFKEKLLSVGQCHKTSPD